MSHQQSTVYPSRPYLIAEKSAQSSISTTPVKMTFDSPSTNTLGMTVSSSTYTATVTGLYFCKTGAYGSAGTACRVLAYKNGSEYQAANGASAMSGAHTSTFVVPLAIGDTLEFYVVLASSSGDFVLSYGIAQLKIMLLN